jgi:hypothetical protein
MALARFGFSDVYVFYDVKGGITCMRIPLKSATHSDGSRPGVPVEVGHPLRGAPLGFG